MGASLARVQDGKIQYALNQKPNIQFMKYKVDFGLVGKPKKIPVISYLYLSGIGI